MAAIESRGFLFASALSYNQSKPLVMMRKKNKLPAERYSVEFELEYGKSVLEIHKDSINKNEKILIVPSREFISSIERVTSISLDRKEGVKLAINKEKIQLSVNSANSGEGNEIITAKFNSNDLNISFNSKYLIDIASEVEDKNLKMSLKDSVSPVLIEDSSDPNSYYVIMSMKI